MFINISFIYSLSLLRADNELTFKEYNASFSLLKPQPFAMADSADLPNLNYLNHNPKVSLRTCFHGFGLLVGTFVFLVWFWYNISPCRPPLGVCGQATKHGIQTLDLLDEAQILTQSSFLTIVCGIIEAELSCLDHFFQRCLSDSDKDNIFYSSLHLEGISAMQQFCGVRDFERESSLVSTCWSAIRRRRNECISEFLQSPGGRIPVIMDSLFDDLYTGVYRKEFCWAVRDAVICSLCITREECGDPAAETLYHLTSNISKMIFSHKCDENIRPDWEDSTFKLVRQSFRPLLFNFLKILNPCFVVLLFYFVWKCLASIRRWLVSTKH